ncbi:transcription initiation factor TFIID subunit 4-like isoform X1 [Conger conger]|uniref:transcription initiation factor TFIID subunit 4-like isoform X1 n=1 Tax=Conger conger TaxID=82655 RepID=UPI002A5A7BEB|nr:transcription initiation factor TFIID subunit 4-like isoform X1 [Conger conger]
MAAGSDLLDEVFFNTEVDEKVVSDIVGSLESELAGSGHGNPEARVQAVGNHVASPVVGGNTNVQDSKMGLAQEVAKAGAGVQGGVINNTRSQSSAMDATTTGITPAARLEATAGLNQGKSAAVSAMVTAVSNHAASKGKIGTSAVQTLNGSNVMNSHTSGSVPAFTATQVSSSCSGGSSSSSATLGNNNTAPALTVVNNGPGSVVKGNVNVLPSTSSTVIQASFVNSHNVVTSTVISSQASGLGSGPTVTLVRPPMQTAGSSAAQNGNNTVLTSSVNVTNLPAPGASALPLQTTVLNSNQAAVSVPTSLTSKTESPKTIIQTTPQAVAPGVVSSAGNLTLAQPIGSSLQPVAPGSGAIGKNPVLQNVTRTSTPTTVAASPGGIRAIAPQVLAPRLPQTPQNQPNIQNIQLPPGMVLVRSDSGQLLMIHQQTLAQMQAQSQSQSAMAPRPATPTSTPPVQITSVQAPGTPIMTRQVTPTTIIKQATTTQNSVQATTTLQRPPVLQNSLMLGGAATPTSIGTAAAVQPGTAQRTVTASTGTATATTTETLENVKKCKNFLSTLIKLASSGKQSSETAANVKELVKSLLEGKMEAEDFTSRLYRELNSSPQPYLVPFLKRSLPALRQLTPDSTAFIQQSQLQQPSAQPSTTTLTTVVLSGPTQRLAGKPSGPAPVTVTSTLHQPVISLAQPGQAKSGQPAPLVLHQSQQPGAMVRPPQVTLAQTPMVTLRQPQGRIMLGQPPMQVKQLQSVPLVKQGMLPGARMSPIGSSLITAAQKNKLKEAGGGTFRDDDDINDVASMAGVNLSEESARILATNSELVGTVTRSCKDEAFLYTSTLHRRILDIGKKHGITELGPEVVNLVSHAAQQRLQSLLEKVSQIAQQKNVSFKEDSRYEQVSDVRAQLKFFEQLDQMEKQRKEEQEREILMKAAKSRSRQEDPEQLRLKQKAKEMQQQELAQMRQRDANLTALAAIGPRKKRKVDSPGSGAGAEVSGSSASAASSSSAGGSRQFSRQRITRVNLRDLLFCMENERETSRSHLLYRAFLK